MVKQKTIKPHQRAAQARLSGETGRNGSGLGTAPQKTRDTWPEVRRTAAPFRQPQLVRP